MVSLLNQGFGDVVTKATAGSGDENALHKDDRGIEGCDRS